MKNSRSEFFSALAFFALLLWIFRHPTSGLGIVYYDDGETLYHALSILSGKIPYRDDFSHHFMGYVMPFVLAAKLKGFSLDLIREVSFCSQLAVAFGVFLTLRLIASFGLSLLAGAIALSAREPWVWGYFQQYEMNFFFIFILYCSSRYCLEANKNPWLIFAGFLCGAAFTIDQRALLYSLIPLFAIAALWKTSKPHPAELCASFLGWLLLPALSVVYLWRNGALYPFWEQTFIFPRQYRIGSVSPLQIVETGLHNHLQLLLDAPVICITALIGLLALARDEKLWAASTGSPFRHRAVFQTIGLTVIPLAIMPFFGGREFPYYVVTWFPYLGIAAAFSTRFFRHISPVAQRFFVVAPAAGFLIPLAVSLSNWSWAADKNYSGDGRAEVAQFLSERMRPSDTMYVWGYRLDLYAALQKLSPYPLANRMTVHPDQLVISKADRNKHVFPPHEKLFFELLKTQPPTYIVTFDREGLDGLPSAANDRVRGLLADSYGKVYRIEKTDFLGGKATFEIYEWKNAMPPLS